MTGGERDDKRRQRQMRLTARKKGRCVCLVAWVARGAGAILPEEEEERGELIALFCQTAFLLDRR